MQIKRFFDYLPGEWKLSRSISSGELAEGKCLFQKTNQHLLHYQEHGLLNNQHIFTREYFYRLNNKLVEIYFDKALSRLFVTIKAASSEAPYSLHKCSNDIYKFKISSASPNSFTTDCIIKGPSKNYSITTIYNKI